MMMTQEEQQFYAMIGKVIREQIRQDDTQDELAELMGIGKTFLSEIERGNKKISLIQFFKLIDRCGLTMTTDGKTIQIFKKITPGA